MATTLPNTGAIIPAMTEAPDQAVNNAAFTAIDAKVGAHLADGSLVSVSLLNSFTGTVRCRKLAHGFLYVTINLINIPTTTHSTVIATLPADFKPIIAIPIAVIKGNISPYDNQLDLNLTVNGDIVLARNNTLSVTTNGAVSGAVVYYAG